MNKKPLKLTIVTSLALVALVSQSTQANTKTWRSNDGFWDNPNNWFPFGVPDPGDNVIINLYGGVDTLLRFDDFTGSRLVNSMETNSDTVILQTGGSLTITNGQIIGFTGSGNYTLNGGSNTSGYLLLGAEDGSNGSYIQNGGTHTVGSLILGGYDAPPEGMGYPIPRFGNGSYNLSSGSLSVVSEIIGYYGVGVFIQSGGTHEVSENLGIGFVGNGSYSLSGGGLSAANENINGGAFAQSGGVHSVNGNLSIERNGIYNLSDGSFLTNFEDIGVLGSGAFTQSGGAHSISYDLILGGYDAFFGGIGIGRYDLSDGSLSASNEYIGANGTGIFTQSGGANSVSGVLMLGGLDGLSSGSYHLSGGSLFASYELLYSGGITQSGGIHTASSLFVGIDNDFSPPSYNLNAGSLSVDTEIIGYSGGGTFWQSGGTNTVNSQLIVGQFTTGGASYNLSGGSLSAVSEVIGYGGAGVFRQSGGTHAVSNTLTLGNTPTANSDTGNYDLNGGDLVAENEIIGDYGFGIFIQSGGTHTVVNSLILGNNIDYYGFELNSIGSYNLNDGELSTGNEIIGNSGIGTFDQGGGVHTVSGSLVLGNNVDSTGSYSLSNVGSLSAGSEIIGNSGSGTFIQNGGTHTVSGNLTLALNSGSTGIYDLKGGTLNVGAIVLGAGASAFNWSAGTLNYGSDLIVSGNPFSFNPTLKAGMALSAPNLTIDADGSFNQTGGTNTASNLVTNSGTYNLSGGTLVVDGGMDNSGNLVLAGGSLSGSGALVNNATVSGHGTIGGSGGFTNNALITQNGGHLILANTGVNANYGNIDLASGFQLRLNGASLNNGGTINLDSANVTGSGALSNTFGGVIAGRGTISSNFNNDGGVVVMTNGTTNITHAFANSGVLQLGGATASLVGGAITNTGTIEGSGNVGNNIANTGIVRANGATLVLGGASVSNNGGGLMTVSTGSTLLAVSGMTNNAGVINLVGGGFDTNNHALVNDGQISGYGTLRTGGLTNNGTMTLTGGMTTVNGNVTNAVSGKIEVAHNPAIFTGDLVNNGQFKSTHTTVTFAGTYTENGAYISDPSINNFTNLIIGSSGYLVGGTGDEWHITGSFENHSLQNALWNTANADLFFDGSGMKNLYVAGADYGLSPLGFTNNFAFESLNLASGAELNILDGNATPGAAMYVQLLNLGGGVSQLSDIHSDYNIYYNPTLAGNAYLLGSTYTLDGGGVLAPAIPEPEFYAMLLAGLGILGFAARRRNKLCNA